jgi:hypothetical protein
MSCCKGKTQLRNYSNFAFMTQILLVSLFTCFCGPANVTTITDNLLVKP